MKKVWIMALSLVLVSSMLVTAAGPYGEPQRTRIEGVITAIDSEAQQLTVGDQTVQVTPNTEITMKEEPFLEDLKVGMTVVVCGLMDGDVLVAHKINVKYGGN